VQEPAASEQPQRAAAREDERVHAHRDRPLRRLGKVDDQQGQYRRRGHRAAQSLDEPGHDQHELIARQPACHRRQRERHDPGEKHPLAPKQVSQASSQQQKAAERDQVRVQNPRQVRLREAEVALHRRERDVHDRPIEHHHQLPHAHNRERHPPSTFSIDQVLENSHNNTFVGRGRVGPTPRPRLNTPRPGDDRVPASRPVFSPC
jgi:hypothetical protein